MMPVKPPPIKLTRIYSRITIHSKMAGTPTCFLLVLAVICLSPVRTLRS